VLEIGQEVQVKVLDIDRDRQRISLGLKQTQSDPWQQVLDSYSVNDVVEGKVTKVVTFGAFVEILPGVEGLVHISELAAHHVENPREIVSQGDVVSVKIIEMDAERRRLSLSLKRVEGEEPRPRPEGAPPLRLSEEVFSEPRAPAAEDEVEELDPTELVAGAVDEAEAEAALEAEPVPDEAEAELQVPTAEAEPETEPEAEAAPEEPEPDA
jgi:small subunit ribosomal protein S1